MPEPSSGKVVVRKDTTVTLECKANGNPSPTVTWTKRSFTSHLNKNNNNNNNNNDEEEIRNGESSSSSNHQHSGRGVRLKKIHKPGELFFISLFCWKEWICVIVINLLQGKHLKYVYSHLVYSINFEMIVKKFMILLILSLLIWRAGFIGNENFQRLTKHVHFH